ncbi:glutathione S-transferase [Mycena rebaudengoi]|nr:glutathione S-transferase [Mycena rebaudengoi]
MNLRSNEDVEPALHQTCTKRVATVLIEKKVAFTFQSINIMAGEHKSKEFRAHQPFGQIPYIDDGGFILYESRSICRYIADKYANQGPKLVPTDLRGKALFEQAASNEYSNFDPFSSRAISEAVFKPMMGMETNKANLEENLKTFSAKLDVYEAILGKQKYLAGDEVTLVDLFHLPYGAPLEKTGSDLVTTKGPNVTRWFSDLQARDLWVAVKDGIPKTSY